MANTLRPEVKRALLYSGLAAAARDPGESLGYAALGFKDNEVLPAEQRMRIIAALSGVLLRAADPDNGFSALSQLAKAANDAYTKPREGRFDPQAIRQSSVMSKASTENMTRDYPNRCYAAPLGQ